jgi:4'-phosphopantetheinyl transferase
VGAAEVYFVDLSPHAVREAAASTRLSEDEQARAGRFLYPGPRRRYVLLRGAVRSLLCERLSCSNEDLTFESAEHGKPFAVVRGAPANIHFNMSDSGNSGLIAIVTRGRIGIDLEERTENRDLAGLAETVFGQEEQATFASATGQSRVDCFYRLWTFKEALLKALGTGLYLDVSGFQVPPAVLCGEAGAVFRFPHLPDIGWWIEDIGTADFAAAIAHEVVEEPEQGSMERAAAGGAGA